MKINAQNSITNISDKLSLSGKILTINGKDYDFDNLSAVPEEGQPEQCHIDSEGVKHLLIHVDEYHQFDFINNNYMLFFDTDLNGDIDDAEFIKLIEHYNLTEDERRENRKAIRAGYSTEEWKARMEACNPKR